MPTRRLAAIMFTDIAGYTKLMQQSEARANELRTRHREVFENAHQTYNGQIIQYFGDGTLSTFDSCVEAVQCAIDMQKAFQEEPQVPLRIGIHLGDIVWSDKDVMGDGVNLASRVESLGIPGSILISDDVNKQIKNQEIETVNMGTFGMKNVDTPLEVFAVQAEGIILPSPKDLKGKGKRLNNILKARRLVQFASVGFLAMAIGALIFWESGAKERSHLLPESIREEKVAVSVFENFTGDEDLDALGYLGSEWISSGLRELKVRTVSPEMVRQNKEAIGILPDNPQGKPSFAEMTGAKYVVAGSYFLEGDSILLKTRLSSTETGEDIWTFPTIRGHKDQKEKLVEEARQYLLGFWVLRKNQKLPNITPPKYEAYQTYVKCKGGCLGEILEKDPNFLLARALAMYRDVIGGHDSSYFANKKYIEGRWEQCTVYEKNYFKFSVNLWEGVYQKAFDALHANYELDPEDYLALHESAYVVSAGVNRPDIAIELYEYIFDNLELFEGKISSAMLRHYFDALIREGNYETVIDFYLNKSDQLREVARQGSHADKATPGVIIALIHQNRIGEVLRLIKNWGNQGVDYLVAAYAYTYTHQNKTENPFFQGLQERLNDFQDPANGHDYAYVARHMNAWDSRAFAYYVLGEWKEAENILLRLRKQDWTSYYGPNLASNWTHTHELWVEGMLGCIYAQQGESSLSYEQVNVIGELWAKYYINQNSPLLRGMGSYLQARIYAVLGEKDKAVEYLKEAIDQGKMYTWWNITFDLDFVNLKGYPPFEALIAPKVAPTN